MTWLTTRRTRATCSPGRATARSRDDPTAGREWTADLDDGNVLMSRPRADGRERRERFIRRTVDWIVVVACAAVRLRQPAPGARALQRGARRAATWGPTSGGRRSSRDDLLPHGRISGWTPDWYAGFPAYQFYMVVPSLLVVALDVGHLRRLERCCIPIARRRCWPRSLGWSAPGPAGWAGLVRPRPPSSSGGVELPYGEAFKLVTVLGRRLAAHRRPTPSVGWPTCPSPGRRCSPSASVLFLFDRNFTIYGGNITSTLAGEFAFSISA